jgi:hypothetical protein
MVVYAAFSMLRSAVQTTTTERTGPG